MPRRQPPPPTDPRRAVVYIVDQPRASAEGPAGWCRAEGLEVVATFVEPHWAQTLAEREALTLALVAVEHLGAGVLVTLDVDALARNAAEYALAHRVVERSGAVWRVINNAEQPFDSALVAQVRAALIAHETLIYKPKVRRGRLPLIKKGKHTGGKVPWGYQIVDGELVEHEEEQGALAELRRMRRRGATYRELAAWLAEKRFPGRGKVHPAVVRRLVADTRRTNTSAPSLHEESEP